MENPEKAQRICVTVTEAEKVFMKTYNLSPSELLHHKISELKANFDQLALKELNKANEKIQNAVKREQYLRDFIEKKGLTSEFLDIK